MQAFRARELRIAGKAKLTQGDFEQLRCHHNLVPSRVLCRVKVEDGIRRHFGIFYAGVERVNLDAAHVGEPHQRLTRIGQ